MAIRQIVGAVLVVIGIAALLWGGVFWTRNKTVLDAGPLEVKARQQEGVIVPPVLATGAIVVGAILLLMPNRKRI